MSSTPPKTIPFFTDLNKYAWLPLSELWEMKLYESAETIPVGVDDRYDIIPAEFDVGWFLGYTFAASSDKFRVHITTQPPWQKGGIFDHNYTHADLQNLGLTSPDNGAAYVSLNGPTIFAHNYWPAYPIPYNGKVSLHVVNEDTSSKNILTYTSTKISLDRMRIKLLEMPEKLRIQFGVF